MPQWRTVTITTLPCSWRGSCSQASPSWTSSPSSSVSLCRWTRARHTRHDVKLSPDMYSELGAWEKYLWSIHWNYYFPVYRRPLLLRSSLQSDQTQICQHGRPNSSGYVHSLQLLTNCPHSGHGGESQSQPHHLLRHTAHALCVHRSRTLAGTDRQGSKLFYYYYYLSLPHFNVSFRSPKNLLELKKNEMFCFYLPSRVKRQKRCPSSCLYRLLRPQWSLWAVTCLLSGAS